MHNDLKEQNKTKTKQENNDQTMQIDCKNILLIKVRKKTQHNKKYFSVFNRLHDCAGETMEHGGGKYHKTPPKCHSIATE